jgi:CHAT domain-containing protein
MRLPVGGVAAVSGVYELPGWQRLADAEAEAAEIVRLYSASPVEASIGGILDLLRGRPEADVIHFAVHGTYEAEEARDGLILVDGSALDPLAVRGIALRGHPFVFLNACQVGRGSQLLGDHAGLAAAFLFAGASGVIAPLWSIDDRLARDIALRFYERALRGEAPAEIMRTERAAFRDTPETTSSTYMAYQFFGHPGLRLEPAAG